MTLELKKIPIGIFLFYTIFLLFLLSGCGEKKEEEDSLYRLPTKEEISIEYGLDDTHLLVSAYITDLESLSKDKLIFIYIGNAKCKYCQRNIKLFNSMARDYNIDTIYYVDSKKTDDDTENDFKAKHDLVNYGVPFILAMKDSLIIDHSENDKYNELLWEETIPFIYGINTLNGGGELD